MTSSIPYYNKETHLYYVYDKSIICALGKLVQFYISCKCKQIKETPKKAAIK